MSENGPDSQPLKASVGMDLFKFRTQPTHAQVPDGSGRLDFHRLKEYVSLKREEVLKGSKSTTARHHQRNLSSMSQITAEQLSQWRFEREKEVFDKAVPAKTFIKRVLTTVDPSLQPRSRYIHAAQSATAAKKWSGALLGCLSTNGSCETRLGQ
eukprot:6471428-Amphidinium_carterae.1